MSRLRTRLAASAIAVAAIAALTVPIGAAGASAPQQGANAKCNLGALKKASGVTEITFWHSMPRANEETLIRLTDEFNSSQSKVAVTLINQTTYADTLQKYVAGLSTGDLPDIVQIEDTGLQQMIDTQSVLPVQSCIKADKYKTNDFVPRVLDYYKVDKTLWPMPFNVSNPVFYYNKLAFEKAGLDPEVAPKTLDEIREFSEKLVSSGASNEAGFGLKTDPWFLEQWLAKAGDPYVNNGNGRKSRATKVAFDTLAGREIFGWMKGMVDDGLAVVNNDEGGSAFDNLLGIGSDSHAMTIDTSASLGTISEVLGGGGYPNVELGVAAMPGPVGKGGVLVGGASLYISNKSDAAKQAAAWEYAKFLAEPEVQAEWAAGTGYVPIRKSSVELPAIQDLWESNPGYKVAYDQLITGVNNVATAGPVIGDYKGVRDVVRTGETSMFTQGVSVKAALKSAAQNADKAMASYNSRIGG
ncbi:MAG TPA: ABC transporter substrate-binding protein [Acidimicrobiia bacterium]|nr:ABC transporter substrate-binding protein [Acidimicrobiia bacterium]